ncbi:MAG: type VI secretion system-associated FHA domain protein TagH [Methylococcales bacterium]|nr:type VI secretion system-associated FHA domain protein TagH [Methylococcales bacterium]
MKLTLSVLSFAGADIYGSKKITLNREGASLGRKEDNALVLPDPKRYVSGHHALIEYRSPDYFIKDTSANGVLINDSKTPLGSGNSIKLNDGDRFTIGDYIIEARLEDDFFKADSQSIPPLSDAQFNFPDDPFADLQPDSIQGMIDKNDLVPSDSRNIESRSNDPFDFPDNPVPEKIDSFQRDYNHISPYEEAFADFPKVTKEVTDTKPAPSIPPDLFSEDWYKAVDRDKKDESKPTAITRTATEPVKPEPLQLEREQAKNEKHAPVPDAVAEELIQNFLRGAQLEHSQLRGSINPEAFFIIGTILRAAIQGTMDVLIGRAKIKNEMHLDVTTIRSRQNNPIKFSVSADEALLKLLMHENSGYMPPKEAVEEAFDDIRAHQYSVIAGMQTALLTVLKRFDPQKLEERLQRLSPISASIPIHKQAKLWNLFEQLYEEIQQEAEDNFYHLFGQAFAETYERQIHKLKSSKKDINFK